MPKNTVMVCQYVGGDHENIQMLGSLEHEQMLLVSIIVKPKPANTEDGSNESSQNPYLLAHRS